MVGDADQPDHERSRREPRQQGRRGRRRPAADRQQSAMDRKADDAVHDPLAGGVDRRRFRQPAQEIVQGRQPLVGDKYGNQEVRDGPDRLLEHHAPLGDEQAVATDQVAFTDRAIGLDPRVVRLGDELDYQIGTRSTGARYSFCPGLTSKAPYQASRLRTV